jgi:MscS family membrane protein
MSSSRVRHVPILLAPVLWALVLALPVAARNAAGPDLSSPRQTFSVFLESMVAVKKGDAARIDDAVACFDLSHLPGVVRAEAGPKLARDLKNYLDKTERIDVAAIPVELDETRWVYRRGAAGEVSVVLADDGRWLFSQQTIDSLPALLESVRDRGFVAGIEGGGGVSTGVAGWIRGRLPDSLLRRTFVLENWQWLALLLLAFVGVVADWLFRQVVGMWVRKLLAKSAHLRQAKHDTDFTRPLGIVVMALCWWMLLGFLDISVRALTALRFATEFVMAAAGVWAAYRLVDLVSAHFIAVASRTDTKVDDILVPMLRRALKIIVIAFGVLFVAQNLDIDITSLLAGLGIGGLALALAAKDTVENLFGSVTVLIDRPFQIGDWVVIGELEGTVEVIGFRSTRIRTFYNSLITVPNARLVNAAVDNLGVRSYRRLKCMISLQYDTPPDRLEAFCEGVRELIRRHPYTRKDYYMVYFNEFADSSFNVLLYTFFKTPDWATELRERHRLFVDVVRLAHGLGVEFAFPTRTLHLASAPAGLAPTTVSAPDAGPAAAPQEGAAGTEGAATLAGHEEAIALGRAEADAIVRGMWPDGIQDPVDFSDPERIRPGAKGG